MYISVRTLILAGLVPAIFVGARLYVVHATAGLNWSPSQARYCASSADSLWFFINALASLAACLLLSIPRWRNRNVFL